MKPAVKIFISLLILAYLFSKLDFHSFLAAISQTQWSYFILACLSQYILLILPACSLKILSSTMGLSLGIKKIYTINLQSMFYSLIIPGDVAAGLARFLKFSKAHRGAPLPLEKIRASVLAMMATDRLLGMGALILPLTPLLFIAPLPERTAWFQNSSIILSLLFLALFVIIYRVPWKRMITLLPKKWKRVHEYGTTLSQALHRFPISKLLFSFSLALIFHGLNILLVDLPLLKSLGIHIPWLEYTSIVIAVRFLRYIPATYSGIGLREGLYPLFLQHYGVPLELAFTLGLLGSVTIILLGLVGGLSEGFNFVRSQKSIQSTSS